MRGVLGADVVRVEPPGGDPLRVVGEMHGDHSYVWALAARTQRSVVLDPDVAAALVLLHRLTAVADVVVVNQPLRLLARWGCTPDDLAARNPRAVVASVTAF